MAVRAVPYVYGAAGTESCPAGFEPIDEEAACKTAAAAVNGRFGEVDAKNMPASGCVLDDIEKSMDVVFNTNAAPLGTFCAKCRLLCMGAPTHSTALVLCSVRAPTTRVAWIHDLTDAQTSTRVSAALYGSPQHYSTACLPTGGCS
jgi:hypothetical protein